MTWDEGLEPSLAQEVDMTLVMAAECADGAFMCADTRECSTLSIGEYKEGILKIHRPTPNVLLGCSGSVSWAADWINQARIRAGADFHTAESAAATLFARTQHGPYPPNMEWLILQGRPHFELWRICWTGSQVQPSFISPVRVQRPFLTMGFGLCRMTADENLHQSPPKGKRGSELKAHCTTLMEHIATTCWAVGATITSAFVHQSDVNKDF